MNDFNYIDYSEMMRDARRGLERESEGSKPSGLALL